MNSELERFLQIEGIKENKSHHFNIEYDIISALKQCLLIEVELQMA